MKEMIISIILAYLISHLSKLYLNYKKTGQWQFASFTQYGGMPSSHTAITIALTTSLFFETGISNISVLSTVFTIIVMMDAIKVRQETGEEAKVLNKLIEKYNLKHKRLAERIGHTPIQVIIGFLLGLILTIIVYSL